MSSQQCVRAQPCFASTTVTAGNKPAAMLAGDMQYNHTGTLQSLVDTGDALQLHPPQGP
jgi:hypothetical protein